MVRRLLIALWGLAFGLSAQAALDVGDKAPDFTQQAAHAGKLAPFSLSQALSRGPVVLYFFPAAFSEGCSVEAHQFAEAIPKFKALGATVIGVSGDDADTLSKFSVQSCHGQFGVASDESMGVIKAYDAVLQSRPDFANRVSYVIAPSGVVSYVYSSLNPVRHVEKTLAAVRELVTTTGSK